MRSYSLSAGLAVVALLTALLGSVSGAQQPPVVNDINGDGAGDLLVGVPLEGTAGLSKAGAVNVIFSNGRRLKAKGNLSLSQGDAIGGTLEAQDLFGASVELIDINGDGYADAVIGSSGERAGLELNAGMFHTILGSADGLDLSTAQTYRQGVGGLPGTAELDDFLGFNIGAGDFNNDGYGDVAVTAPFEDIAGQVNSGGVLVVLGSSDGLDTASGKFFSQKGKVEGTADPGDTLGWSVVSGDFNGDGYDDIAVGAPGEDYRGRPNSGAVNVLYGSKKGITRRRDQLFSQAGAIKGRPAANDLFGFALAASDVNCDGRDDLLVGVPNEGVGGVNPAGMVNVILGSKSGLTKKGNTKLHQGQSRVAGSLDFNQFGAALAGGDFNGDGCGDVAIGAHTTDIGGSSGVACLADPKCAREAGAVVIVYGSTGWPTPGSTTLFSQKGPVPGPAEPGDFFGRTLGVVDINGDGRDDLVVGAPGEGIRGRENAGSITVLRGSAKGLTDKNSYAFSQSGRIKGKPEAGDQFSSALADGGS